MIEYLLGKLIHKTPTSGVVNVNGIGYGVQMTLRTSSQLTQGSDVELHCFLAVKEDSLTLFGFSTTDEKKVFLLLIEVNGIGPKMAQRLLSECSPNDLVRLVATEDVVGLTK